MHFLEWSDEYEIGIPEIDAQHQGLVDCINDLAEVKDQQDIRVIQDVFARLIDYTVNHFKYEEDLQASAGYENIDGHKQQHVMFVRKMETFQKRAAVGENVAMAVLSLLKLWLLAHIQREDMGYVAAVKAAA